MLSRRWWGIRHDKSGQRRLLRKFTLGRLFIRRHSHLFFVQFRQQIAQRGGLFTLTYAQNGVVRRFHLIVWHDDDAYIGLAGFNGAYRSTFFVQEVRSNRHRNDSVNFFSVLFQRFFFDQAQNGKRQRFVIAYGTRSATARADVMAGLAKRRAQTLTRHLQQAKA